METDVDGITSSSRLFMMSQKAAQSSIFRFESLYICDLVSRGPADRVRVAVTEEDWLDFWIWFSSSGVIWALFFYVFYDRKSN